MAATRDTADAFSKDLSDFARRVRVGLDQATRKVAFDLHANVVDRTPVDTGRARASWGLSEGVAKDDVQPEGTYEKDDAQKLVSVSPRSSGGDAPIIWLWNNIPYIETLEFGGYPGDGPKTVGGYSKQAPVGMARLAVREEGAKVEHMLARMIEGAR